VTLASRPVPEQDQIGEIRVGQVVAMGGGGWMMDDPVLDGFVADLVTAARPRICFLPTASGDHPSSDRFLDAFPAPRFDASILWLFDREVADVGAVLGEQDVVLCLINI
jgi:dipeptidase E